MQLHAGTKRPLVLDFDGTPAALVEHFDRARFPMQLRRFLENSNGQPSTRVGAMSDRALSDLRDKRRRRGLVLAGHSGLELDFCGVRETKPNAGAVIARLEGAADSFNGSPLFYAGLWIERTRFGITIHFRRVGERNVDDLFPLLRKHLARFEPSLRISAGPKAIEMTPIVGWTKGSAVRMFHD